jgi:hypothetical protein
MLGVVWKLRGRIAAFALSFVIGLFVAWLCRLLLRAEWGRAPVVLRQAPDCSPEESFGEPSEVLAALKHNDVGVRADAFRRLFLRPGVRTAYYDFERDKDYPEVADRARLRLVNLDESPEPEALITFVRTDSPVAVVLKRCACGWRAAAAVSAWLRFEDYPYEEWVEVSEAIRPGQHVLVVRDSTGDALRYTRRARVLRLAGEGLEQLAEVEEERIEPAQSYTAADWSRVKRRRVSSLHFIQEAAV